MSARDYLEGFAVQEAITAALGAVIAERPANPIKALSKKLLDAEEKREEGKMLAEIAKMTGPEGFDLVIVCCSNQAAEDYWQGGRGDRQGGDRRRHGALRARGLERRRGQRPRYARLPEGGREGDDHRRRPRRRDEGRRRRCALPHAGKGTRLAPLPGAENNNKPGVKLPALLTVNGELAPITSSSA